ncbi:ABC-2 type transport system permease protein [Lutibacter oricola]|uniref:ABC-2 type transport system permease protein n=1 Tax=Lutibacter oricola TaxID=762486 RepID=A0A1H3GKC8_9FLAO|nr:ABC transporter permease [Lutibacter oricola]SDY03557.1 ABC-2 type transport system permease protein [Lutibacter oricola]
MKTIISKYQKTKLSYKNAFLAEWNAIKNDKAVISTFFSVAFIILAVYTYIYSNEIITEVPIAIVNQDGSKTSRDYIAMLNASDGIKTIATYTNLQEAKTDYYSKKIMGILIIPQNFGKDIRTSTQTTITSFSDASNMIFYKKVLVDISVATGYFNAGIVIKKTMANGIAVSQATQEYSPIKTISTSLFNTSSGYATYMAPMLTALIVQLVLLMGIGIINGSQKENKTIIKTFPQVLNKGGTITTLAAKSTIYLLIFAVILPIQFGLIYTIFSIPLRTNLPIVYLFALPYLTSVIFLGIAISSLFKRREDSIVFLVLVSIPSLMLSGLSFPTENFYPFYQELAKLLPSTSGIKGFVKLTQMEASFTQVLSEWNHLWLLTLIYFIIAIITLKLRAINEQTKILKTQ